MIPLIEIIAISAGFLVLCFILGLIYLLIRRFKTISMIYLLVSVVILFHALTIFILIYVPGLLPNFLSNYAVFWTKILM